MKSPVSSKIILNALQDSIPLAKKELVTGLLNISTLSAGSKTDAQPKES